MEGVIGGFVISEVRFRNEGVLAIFALPTVPSLVVLVESNLFREPAIAMNTLEWHGVG